MGKTFALTLLNERGVKLLDAARLIRNALDSFSKESGLTPLQFCAKVISTGLRHIRNEERSIKDGFLLYLETKRDLRPDSLKDIRYLGNRLINSNPKLSGAYFSEIKAGDCEHCLSSTFKTPSQFNKARTMLHALYSFCLKMRWSEENPISPIPKKKIFEKEITPLGVDKVQKLLSVGKTQKHSESAAALGIMLWTGMRPNEVSRLKWEDIDFSEKVITVKKENSKTGGTRQIEMCPLLREWLNPLKKKSEAKICPKNWLRKWKSLREDAGFKHIWVNDVLRHTYASYFAKRFKDLPRLQLNMGHRDLSLLRSRYVNMTGIKKSDAKAFFESLGRDITYKTLPLN